MHLIVGGSAPLTSVVGRNAALTYDAHYIRGGHWEVVIEDRGCCGAIEYREVSGSVPFYWEFGGASNLVATISGPEPGEWELSYHWAQGRRLEIMRRVAKEVIRKQGRRCKAAFDEDMTTIYLRTSRFWVAAFVTAFVLLAIALVALLSKKP